MFTPITFEDVFELSEQVHLAHEQSLIMETATNLECIAPHKLSVLFLVYAMGALMDTNLPVSYVFLFLATSLKDEICFGSPLTMKRQDIIRVLSR